MAPPRWRRGERCRARSAAEHLRLRGGELVVGQRARLVQRRETLELGRGVSRRRGDSRRGRRRALRLLALTLGATLAGVVRDPRGRCTGGHAHHRPAAAEEQTHAGAPLLTTPRNAWDCRAPSIAPAVLAFSRTGSGAA